MMGEFKVHQVRFFDYMPKAIHCMAYEDNLKKLAVSRSDGSIDIWSANDHWYQEQVLPPSDGESVESMVWCQGHLYSAGLHGNIYQHDLLTGQTKSSASSNSGAIWCLTKNAAETHIAAGTEDGCVVLFAITGDGIIYERALDKQEGRILSLAWHSGLDLIVTGGIDNIRIWSISSGHAIQRLTLGRVDQNRETIVWTIAVTEDFTIISGDSRGKTSFWNGKQGTLLKSFHCHKADVLSVAVNKDGTSVMASGIDPSLVQFEFIASQPNSDWKMWVRSNIRSQHTHDVRAVVHAGNYVITGGVDCNLIFNNMDGTKVTKKWRIVPGIHQRSLVCCARAKNMILLQYPTYLELWKLGSTNKTSDKANEYLPLKTNQVKLLHLNAKSGENIVCCALSDDGHWLAYSDASSLRLFRVTVEDTEMGAPRVQLSRVHNVPLDVLPSHILRFTPGSNMLLNAICGGLVQVLHLQASHVTVVHVFNPASDTCGINLLSVNANGEHFATTDRANNVHIYSINKKKHIVTLPHYPFQACAIAFSPSAPEIAVAYCDQKIVEYNYSEREYTSWSRNMTWHPQWLKRTSKLRGLMYHPAVPHILMGYDEQLLLLINKQQKMAGSDVQLFNKSSWREKDLKVQEHGLHYTFKYKYILHADVLQDQSIVIVERPPLSIMENLPPTLKHKKFAT